MIRPPRLRPGDPVAVVAPSGPVHEGRFELGRGRLAKRYDLRFTQRLFERKGYLAGDDDARLRELNLALADPDTRAILCARGGFGTQRLLTRLDGAQLRRTPKPIVGFSDITALHAFALHHGVTSVHSPVVTQLGVMSPEDEAALYALLEGEVGAPLAGLRSIAARASCEGPLVGGNLAMVTSLLATPYALPLDGAVLLLEEVGEAPYRIDRMLTQLELAGAWERVAGVVIGELTNCKADDSPTANEVVHERLAGLSVPVLVDLPVGHGKTNRALGHGVRVRVDGTNGALTPLEPTTQ
jgi:muramoyltetrapeptide carboxypeptidase